MEGLQSKLTKAAKGPLGESVLAGLDEMLTIGSNGLHLHYLHILDFHLAWDVLCWLGPRPEPWTEKVELARFPRRRAFEQFCKYFAECTLKHQLDEHVSTGLNHSGCSASHSPKR